MKKSLEATMGHGRLTVFPSSGASKDRFELQVNSGSVYGGSAALLPLGNRRSVPSKWDDAEKWICSPVSVDGLVVKNPDMPANRRRPKSKSSPLGAHCATIGGGGFGGGGEYSYSSSKFDDKRARTFTTNSPSLRETWREDGGFGNGSIYEMVGQMDVGWEGQMDRCIPRVTSLPVPGWTELLMEASSSLASFQEGKTHMLNNGATLVSHVAKKDVGTQKSPDGRSTCSSPNAELCTSRHPKHSLTIGELHKHLTKLEVRDVQVDDQVVMKKWSKKQPNRRVENCSSLFRQCKNKTVDANDSTWEVSQTKTSVSKIEAEEARIIAWENLQKAKAEAAIRELEMKLEKKRTSSMDKILNKLSSAEKKANDMRRSLNYTQARRTFKSPGRIKLFRSINRFSFSNGCFHSQAH